MYMDDIKLLAKNEIEFCLSRKNSSKKEEKDRKKNKNKIESIKIMIYVENIN